MNIFVLDTDPIKAATYHHDRHVVKMFLETTQLLSTYARRLFPNELCDKLGVYKSTHNNHPCSIWLTKSGANVHWTFALAEALHDEYKLRYSKVHKSSFVLKTLSDLLVNEQLTIGQPSEFAQAMPVEFKSNDAVSSYRQYYIHQKLPGNKYTNRSLPPWAMCDIHERAA